MLLRALNAAAAFTVACWRPEDSSRSHLALSAGPGVRESWTEVGERTAACGGHEPRGGAGRRYSVTREPFIVRE